MPDSRMILLSDGPGWGPAPRTLSDQFDMPARRSGARMAPSRARRGGPVSRHVEQLAGYVGAQCESAEEAQLAGEAYERLVAMTLSRKLSDSRPMGRAERAKYLRDAGMPGYLYANPATEAIFTADAEGLGKGGIIGQITATVNRAIKPVSQIATAVTSGGTKFLSSAATSLTNIGTGLNQAVEHGVTGFANQAANFASSPAAVSMAGDMMGIPMPGGVGSAGFGSVGGSSGTIGGAKMGAAPSNSLGIDTNTLILAGVALVAVYLLTSGSGRKR